MVCEKQISLIQFVNTWIMTRLEFCFPAKQGHIPGEEYSHLENYLVFRRRTSQGQDMNTTEPRQGQHRQGQDKGNIGKWSVTLEPAIQITSNHKSDRCLRTLDTLGNCQRPVFSLGVSKHMLKDNKHVKILAQLVIKNARQ